LGGDSLEGRAVELHEGVEVEEVEDYDVDYWEAV
jgi:hypothetical protein